MTKLSNKFWPYRWAIGIIVLGASSPLMLMPFMDPHFNKELGIGDFALLENVPIITGSVIFGVGVVITLLTRFRGRKLNQWHILWVGFAFLVLSGLFPPQEYGKHELKFEFIFNGTNPTIRFGILFIEWVIITAATGIASAQITKTKCNEITSSSVN